MATDSGFTLNVGKAGMDTVDQHRANQIIYDVSKDSKVPHPSFPLALVSAHLPQFFHHQQRKASLVAARAQRLKHRASTLPTAVPVHVQHKVHRVVEEARGAMDLSHS